MMMMKIKMIIMKMSYSSDEYKKVVIINKTKKF